MRYHDFPFRPVQRTGPTQLIGNYQTEPTKKNKGWEIGLVALPILYFVGSVFNEVYQHSKVRRLDQRISALEGKPK